MDSALFKSKIFKTKPKSASKTQQHKSEHKSTAITTKIANLKEYLHSLTKIRPNLDAKFTSDKSAVKNIHKINLDVQPYKYDETQKTTEILTKINNCNPIKWIASKKNTKNQEIIDIIDGFARGISNLINSRYQQQYKITNAYIKLWEIYETFDWVIPKHAKDVNCFHMAEAPGQWINTTNHYFHQHMPRETRYNWFANSLNPDHPRMKGIIKALPDSYGFIKQNPKKWLYGDDDSGDITIPENVAWFNKFLLQAIPGKLDLITGDAGTNPNDVDLELLQRIDIAQAIVVACTARPGSNCVIKQFLPFMSLKPESDMADGFFMSFMYLYHILFTEFHMFKPLSSSPGSGEFYVVARGFHGINDEQRQIILDYQGQFSMNKPMFAKSDIPSAFSDKVCKFINDLQQINILNKSATCQIAECFMNQSTKISSTTYTTQKHTTQKHTTQHTKSQKDTTQIDCNYFMDKKQFAAAKNRDLERYLDKYRIARTDKLKKHKFANKTNKHHKNRQQQKRHKYTHKLRK
jgi:hypothetical protein